MATELDMDQEEEKRGQKERKNRRQNLRRQKILDEAENILTQKGFGELKLTEIAAASDLNHSNIYYYFKDVQEIYDEICIRQIKREVDVMIGLLTHEPKSIIDVFEGRTRYYFQNDELFQLVYNRTQKMKLSSLKEQVYPLSAKISQKIEVLLENGKQQQKVRKSVRSRKLSNLIVLTSNGILATYLAMKRMGGDLKFGPEEILKEASRVFGNPRF